MFAIYKAEFDLAFQERTMFILTQHPHVGGRRSRIVQLDRLITYIQSKGEGVVCDHGAGGQLRETDGALALLEIVRDLRAGVI